MKRPEALVPAANGAVTLRGTAGTPGEALRSPASDAPCVHWRLRIFEVVAPGMELVHEVSAPEPLELRLEDPRGLERAVRVAAERARIEAQPVFHGEGSRGALAVARRFGLGGRVRVEEVVLRPGEVLEAEGVLFDSELAGGGPYRGPQTSPELFEATLRVSRALALRPALLPWALGTVAALMGVAAAAASSTTKLWQLGMHGPAPSAEIGAAKIKRSRWP